jgi:AcrR family transcriptional regulator
MASAGKGRSKSGPAASARGRKGGGKPPAGGPDEEPQAGRPAQRRRTRRAIVSAAMELLAAGESPSVAEVAAAAEVSRRTVYSYFPTLDHLLADASLGLLSAEQNPALAEPPADAGAPQRLELLAHELQRMSPEAERLGRKLLAVTVEAPPPEGGPRRSYRRVEWIERALAPAREELGEERFERLVSAVAMVIGFEPLLVQRDIRGLRPGEGAELSTWAATALLRAALEEAGA